MDEQDADHREDVDVAGGDVTRGGGPPGRHGRPARDDVVHLDSAQLRRLAHPLRSVLLGALRLHGPATSAQLAQRLDTNTGATSYHLRQLAEVGLVVEAPELGTGRERFWRAAHAFTSYGETVFADDPEDRAAVDWLLGHNARTTQRWRAAWLRARDGHHPAWRAAASPSDVVLLATPAQLERLLGELVDVVHRHRDAGPDEPGEDGVDATPVVVLLEGFPFPDATA